MGAARAVAAAGKEAAAAAAATTPATPDVMSSIEKLAMSVEGQVGVGLHREV